MYKIGTLISCLVFLISCSGPSSNGKKEEKENREAKQLLQGIWIDDDSEIPLLQIKGDTIYYLDDSAAPVAFKVVGDSLKTYGSQISSYHIKKQGEHIFWVQSVVGDILQLSRSESEIDSILVEEQFNVSEPDTEVIQKDEVVFYNNVRYRGYVYINPTHIKIVLPEITDEGLEIDNVYYDNIIHICVFEGKKRLFGKDVKKQDFEHLIPAEYFQRAILSDMDFVGVNEKGYQYQATVCIPNYASCYQINISITKDGDINYELVG